MRLTAPNYLVVSRRNLLTLLAKLEGYPEESACTIIGGIEAPGFILRAEPDEVHYAARPFGVMHEETEQALTGGE